jgi:hypothetical protein
MQVFFTQHAQTVTNNQMMQSSVAAKGQDFQATNAYAIALQTEQSRQAIESGQGTSAGSNSLQYLNNPLCVPASVSTGAAQATVGTRTSTFTETIVQNSGSNNANVSAAPPSSAEARMPQVSSVTSISNLYNAGSAFAANPPAGGTNNSGSPAMPNGPGNDSQGNFGLDTAAYRLLTPNAYPTSTAAGSLLAADNNYIRYILGVYPEVPPTSATGASGQQATLAEREKVAFMTTAELGLKEEQSLRIPQSNNGGINVAAIYSAVGQGTGPQGGIGSVISKAQLLDAMFRQPVENPNSFVNLTSLSVPSKALQFIAGELMMSNYLNYERYLVERETLDVNSAQLAIAYRDFNFQGHP